jgi:ubiquinone/menaquinone biosynthesis C-methylase UbiE
MVAFAKMIGDGAAMDHNEVGRYWDRNADTWTALVRQGYDVYRDHLNTPAFLAMLPEVRGLRGIDIGCGEGHNTRMLARRGAHMTAIDISEAFIRHAKDEESRQPLGIAYQNASAVALPFAGEQFDFATAFMSLMDIPEQDKALAESRRVLRPNGFLQFSIIHPCFVPPHRRNIRDAQDNVVAVEIGRYFDSVDGEIERWTFNGAPKEVRSSVAPFEVPRFHRTLSQWVNMTIEAGFAIERMGEPRADDETAQRVPYVADTQVAPIFLHVRARKTDR